MAPHILPRENFATTNTVAGGLIAGFLCLVVILCLLCLHRLHRSKANMKGGAVPFDSKGGVRPTMTETNPLSTSIPIFSRQGLTASIVMPEKSITRKPSSHVLSDRTVVSSQLQPSALSHSRPLSRTSSGSPRPRAMSILNPACSRQSRSSTGHYVQFPPGLGSRRSSTFSTASMQTRPVRQLFEPVLPDELSLVRYGEYLTVLQPFDDGWCLVARDKSQSPRTSRLWVKGNADNVDIGLVPAWVFIQPLKGIAVTRPFRSASVNALDLGQNPVPTYARHAIVSWSNFA